jgi:hypothetical protein
MQPSTFKPLLTTDAPGPQRATLYPSFVPRHSSLNCAVRTVVLTSIAGFGHVIYPLYLLKRTAGATAPEPKPPADWPPLSIVVPAYLEAGVIRAKIDNALSNGYPGEV